LSFKRVVSIEPLAVSDAMNLPVPWPESIQGINAAREESEKAGRGTVAAIGIICPPLSVQMVPFGSLVEKTVRDLPPVPHWKETLMRDVEIGRKFTSRG
jgi:splicing suppressor protein 51